MAGVENHHTAVGQHQERGVIVVVGLEVGAHQHVGLPAQQPVVLRGLHVAMHVDVAYIGGIHRPLCPIRILIMQCPGVGKPAPGTLLRHHSG